MRRSNATLVLFLTALFTCGGLFAAELRDQPILVRYEGVEQRGTSGNSMRLGESIRSILALELSFQSAIQLTSPDDEASQFVLNGSLLTLGGVSRLRLTIEFEPTGQTNSIGPYTFRSGNSPAVAFSDMAAQLKEFVYEMDQVTSSANITVSCIDVNNRGPMKKLRVIVPIPIPGTRDDYSASTKLFLAEALEDHNSNYLIDWSDAKSSCNGSSLETGYAVIAGSLAMKSDYATAELELRSSDGVVTLPPVYVAQDEPAHLLNAIAARLDTYANALRNESGPFGLSSRVSGTDSELLDGAAEFLANGDAVRAAMLAANIPSSSSRFAEATTVLVDGLKALGDIESAEWLVGQRRHSLVDSAESLYRTAISFSVKEDVPMAIDYIERAIALDSEPAIYHMQLGDFLAFTNNYDRAVEAYQAGVRREPSNADYAYKLAVAYHSDGRIEDARRQYRNVLAIDELHEFTIIQLTALYGAEAYAQGLEGRFDLAAENYRKAVDLSNKLATPNEMSLLVHNNLIESLIIMDDFDGAADAIGLVRKWDDRVDPRSRFVTDFLESVLLVSSDRADRSSLESLANRRGQIRMGEWEYAPLREWVQQSGALSDASKESVASLLEGVELADRRMILDAGAGAR